MNKDHADELLNKYLPIVKRHFLPLLLGLVGLIFLVYGLIVFFGSAKKNDEVIFESGASTDTSVKTMKSQESLTVDVEGGVVSPGVYHLPISSHLQDALIAAGGLSQEADREWVAKTINMASKLADGAKIYIQKVGEAVSGTSTSSQSVVGSLVNINSASSTDLDKLPGIGAVTVQKIIDGRPYSTIDELLSKKIVGSKVFGQIKDKITVY